MAAADSRRKGFAVRVIFLGPPGAGKGTQAAKLAAQLSVPKVGTGEMLRSAIAAGAPLGREARPTMERGDLVPDELLVALVRQRIELPDCDRGFVLDGFPRTIGQAQGLEAMTSGDPGAWTVFDFEVPREVVLSRLSGRRWCPACQATYHLKNDPPKRPGICDRDGIGLLQRPDDREAVVAERLRQYDQRTFPLIEYYRTRARMITVDGNRPMDLVFQELVEAVEVRA